MERQVRIGVIGTSWWEEAMHLPCLESHPGALVAAVCGRNRARAEELAKKHGIAGVYTDYREMIEKGGIRAIVVASPDDLHHRMTLDALDAGLHVLCEKPMALELEQAREMRDRARAAGVVNMVMFTHRWWPHIAHVKKLLDGGSIGGRRHIDIDFFLDYGADPRYEWRFDGKRSNGVLGDLGSHSIDLARLFFGGIVKVSAVLASHVTRLHPDGGKVAPAPDSAQLSLTFDDGAHGRIFSSYSSRLGGRVFELGVRIYGDAGTIESTFSALNAEVRCLGRDSKGFETVRFPEYVLGGEGPADFNRLFGVFTKLPAGDRLFVDRVLEGAPSSPDFSDGLEVQRVIDAARRSHLSGRELSV